MVNIKNKKYKKEDTLYKLFEKAWKTNKYDKKEFLKEVSPRDAKYLKMLGETLKNPKVAEFFKKMNDIESQESIPPKGWLTEIYLADYYSKHGKFPEEIDGNTKRERR